MHYQLQVNPAFFLVKQAFTYFIFKLVNISFNVKIRIVLTCMIQIADLVTYCNLINHRLARVYEYQMVYYLCVTGKHLLHFPCTKHHGNMMNKHLYCYVRTALLLREQTFLCYFTIICSILSVDIVHH